MGIISGLGSFRGRFGDHFRVEDHFGVGIISGAVQWDGTQIKGTFYEQDLQKVTVEDDDLFRIDKIVKRKGVKVLVRWKGWPDKYDTWLNKKDVLTKP